MLFINLKVIIGYYGTTYLNNYVQKYSTFRPPRHCALIVRSLPIPSDQLDQ